MPNVSDPAAKLYATALGEVGREQHALGQIHDDLTELRKLYDGDPWFRQFFTSPRIDREVKWDALHKALEGQVCRPVLGLVAVLVAKGREVLFDNVVDQFHRYKDEHENRLHVYVTVAKPMDDAFRGSLTKRLAGASGKNVEMHERVDPAVLGGAAIRVGDRVIDRTLRTRLAALRKQLLTQV